MDKLWQYLEEENSSRKNLAKKIDRLLHIHTEEVQTDGRDTFHFYRYEPTPYQVLYKIFQEYPLTPSDTLLDYGCGMGRLLFFASLNFGCRGIGVEYAEPYYRAALKNLTDFRGAHKDRISFVNCPAETYILPDTVNYIYFFNPFSTTIFRSVLSNIEASLARHPREVTLILYYPEDDTIFYIERHTSLERVAELEAEGLGCTDRRDKFCVYRR